MAATREKRSNAGNRMSKLLDAEEEDDFYKTTYGGFEDVEEDQEYDSEKSDSDDSSDSDISASEDDEVVSDQEGDGPKRKCGIVTKAYKEPPKKKKIVKPTVSAKPVEKRKHFVKHGSVHASAFLSGRKSSRRSTEASRKQLEKRIQERDANRKKHTKHTKKVHEEVRRLTQEELLEEAKITEEENLKSLDTYFKMELEKKRSRQLTRTYTGPIIRYHSVTMPLIEEISEVNNAEEKIDVDGTEEAKDSSVRMEKCSRNFITFTDDEAFDKYFPQRKLKPPLRYVCPITRLPAKYFDPITQCPYSTLNAFQKIRKLFYSALDNKMSDRKQSPALKRWLEYRKQCKTEKEIEEAAKRLKTERNSIDNNLKVSEISNSITNGDTVSSMPSLPSQTITTNGAMTGFDTTDAVPPDTANRVADTDYAIPPSIAVDASTTDGLPTSSTATTHTDSEDTLEYSTADQGNTSGVENSLQQKNIDQFSADDTTDQEGELPNDSRVLVLNEAAMIINPVDGSMSSTAVASHVETADYVPNAIHEEEVGMETNVKQESDVEQPLSV